MREVVIERYSDFVQRLRAALLDSPGATSPELRRSIVRYAAGLAAPGAQTAQLPEDCAELVRKVATEAYRVTTEDVAALKRAGFSDEAIFEIATCAATGSGLGRLERAIAALKGVA